MKPKLKNSFKLLLLTLLFSSCSNIRGITGVQFPQNARNTINAISDTTNANLYMGNPEFVRSGKLNIWYESIGNPENPTILLIMGFTNPGTGWPNDFVQLLVDKGYHVVRFDNRDTGHSSEVVRWRSKDAYDLSDMASDAKNIINHLGKEKVHVVGISMGGMIAQTLAIEHPDKVYSLTSIASTAWLHDPELKTFSTEVVSNMFLLTARYGFFPKKWMKKLLRRLEIIAFLDAKNKLTEEDLKLAVNRQFFEVREKREGSKMTSRKHLQAIKNSGSRLPELYNLSMPVLIIHGQKDKLIQPQHSEKLHKNIPHSKMVRIDNMGHMISAPHFAAISEEITQFINANEG